jgi:hypothetical protein
MNFFRHNLAIIPTPLTEPLCAGSIANANGTRIELEVATMDLPKIRLRGSMFFYTPRPLTNAQLPQAGLLLKERLRQRPTIVTDGQTVALIYRGHTYERKLQPPQPYRQPRAINWRWQ